MDRSLEQEKLEIRLLKLLRWKIKGKSQLEDLKKEFFIIEGL